MVVLHRIYREWVQTVRHLQYLSTFLNGADKLALVFSILMLMGIFMPWASANRQLTQTGLMGGGDIHLVLSFITIFQVYKAAKYHSKALRNKKHLLLLPERLRRISLSYLLIGLISTFCASLTLLHLGCQYTNIGHVVDVRVGFYLSSISGFAILLCGLERFIDCNKRKTGLF